MSIPNKEPKKKSSSQLLDKFKIVTIKILKWKNWVFAWEKEIFKTITITILFLALYFVLTRLIENLPCWVDVYQLVIYPLEFATIVLATIHTLLVLTLFIVKFSEPIVWLRDEYHRFIKKNYSNIKILKVVNLKIPKPVNYKRLKLKIVCYLKNIKFKAIEINENLTVISLKTPGKTWKKQEWKVFLKDLGFLSSDWKFGSDKDVYVIIYDKKEKQQRWDND
jgi:hypothetical protein